MKIEHPFERGGQVLPPTGNTKAIAWFSCGVTSTVAIRIALSLYEEVRIYYFDTGQVHEDNKRFLEECQKWFGQEILTLKSKKYESPLDVARKRRFINGPSGALCTFELKKALRLQVQESLGDLSEWDQIFGFETSKREVNRAIRFSEQYPDTNPVFPLIEKGLTKPNCIAALEMTGIEVPAMYKLGYHNNNCLAGDTRIITSRGAVPIKTIVDTPTEIRTSEGFETSTVKDYGVQACYEITIRRGNILRTITAASSHRWYLHPRFQNHVIHTEDVVLGEKIPFLEGGPGEVVRTQRTESQRVYCPRTTTSDIVVENGIITGNCLGCFKGGMGYWNKVRDDFPEIFQQTAEVERELGRTCLRQKGKSLYLDELEPGTGRHSGEISAQCGVICQVEFADLESPRLPDFFSPEDLLQGMNPCPACCWKKTPEGCYRCGGTGKRKVDV